MDEWLLLSLQKKEEDNHHHNIQKEDVIRCQNINKITKNKENDEIEYADNEITG